MPAIETSKRRRNIRTLRSSALPQKMTMSARDLAAEKGMCEKGSGPFF